MTLGGEGAGAEYQLPSADEAERWENLLPGSTERLLSIMEQLAAHKIEYDNKLIEVRKAEVALSNQSLSLAFLLALLLIVPAIVLAFLGHYVTMGILLGVPSAGIAIAFVPKAIANRGSAASKGE